MSRTAASIMEREIKNNPRIRSQILDDLEDSVARAVGIPSHHNASYGISDFNGGMIRAAAKDASVGGCATARRVRRALTEAPPRGTVPSDEWFRKILAAVTPGAVEGVFAGRSWTIWPRCAVWGSCPATGWSSPSTSTRYPGTTGYGTTT